MPRRRRIKVGLLIEERSIELTTATEMFLNEALAWVCQQYGDLLGPANIKAAYKRGAGQWEPYQMTHFLKTRSAFFASSPYTPLPPDKWIAPGDLLLNELFVPCPRCHRHIGQYVSCRINPVWINHFWGTPLLWKLVCPHCGEKGQRFEEWIKSWLSAPSVLFISAYKLTRSAVLSDFCALHRAVYDSMWLLHREHPRHFEVLIYRLGFCGEVLTLEATGRRIERPASREVVRRLESTAIKYLEALDPFGLVEQKLGRQQILTQQRQLYDLDRQLRGYRNRLFEQLAERAGLSKEVAIYVWDLTIMSFDLPVRAIGSLQRYEPFRRTYPDGRIPLLEILAMSGEELLRVDGFGQESLRVLRETLAKRGLYLSGEWPE